MGGSFPWKPRQVQNGSLANKCGFARTSTSRAILFGPSDIAGGGPFPWKPRQVQNFFKQISHILEKPILRVAHMPGHSLKVD